MRLASLVHDLGHLPFSHDFEAALEQYLRRHRTAHAEVLLAQGPGGDKIHERVGYALASRVSADVFNQRLKGTPIAKAAEVSLSIGRDILNAPALPELDAGDEALTLSWLHGLVAGELDVDRADYVLRDARHTGSQAAGFDLDRLVDNIAPAVEQGRVVTAVLPQGVSAAESLSVARFRMYAWAIYHHKVQQVAAGLHRSLLDLLENGGGLSSSSSSMTSLRSPAARAVRNALSLRSLRRRLVHDASARAAQAGRRRRGRAVAGAPSSSGGPGLGAFGSVRLTFRWRTAQRGTRGSLASKIWSNAPRSTRFAASWLSMGS